jgi:hypothetical protein
LEVDADRMLMGRDPSCDVVLDDKSVSRRHACLERRGEGWAVVDQGSANGTFVDGEPVREAPLHDGQELRLGMVALRVEIESPVPHTMLMGEGTVLMPVPPPAAYAAGPGAAPLRAPARPVAAAPPPVAAAPAPMPMAPPAPAWAPPPEPDYGGGRAMTPQEEAASLLGLPLNASPHEVSARYEELSADLNVKLAAARTPNLKQTYQKNLDEVRRAAEVLSPGLLSANVADLPSATPSVVPDDLDMSLPAPVRAAIAPPAEASEGRSGGGPHWIGTTAGFFLVALLSASAFFGMSKGKKEKEFDKLNTQQDVVTARKDSVKYEPIDRLEKGGALQNGTFKICNKASVPLQAVWAGVVFAEKNPDEPVPTMRVFNSGQCRGFKLDLPAGSEKEVPPISGNHPQCQYPGGHGLFYGLGITNPKKVDEVVYFSGMLHMNKDCVVVGQGW